MKRKLSEEKIKWTLISPRSPWSGSYWERSAGSVKTELKRDPRHAYVSDQQLTSILCKTEAQVNARLLTFLNHHLKGT
ncbi:hypothetical protein M514_27037 [Trichuris suis]|uniref:Uncharacterized protein n=1 Tax=Trichuris suis TaxID=68888 RepID=A0A085MU94_9BILA|nr:hypothetical protein M514_27037 [Trichuris suis]KHJ40813.1 hypothetical protein D918_09169 [Trichuris suis]